MRLVNHEWLIGRGDGMGLKKLPDTITASLGRQSFVDRAKKALVSFVIQVII